jgi:hypothetical protein
LEYSLLGSSINYFEGRGESLLTIAYNLTRFDGRKVGDGDGRKGFELHLKIMP